MSDRVIVAKNGKSHQRFIEKIEILDESTGQIILKERTHPFDIDSHSKSDDDEVLNELSMSCSMDLDTQEACSVAHPHGTILSKQAVSQLEPVEVCSPDGKGSFYRCPLCTLPQAYYNVQASKVIDHLQGNKHFGIAVKHRGWLICKCDNHECDPDEKIKTHRHCPHCARIFARRNEFVSHLERCCPVNVAPAHENFTAQSSQSFANSVIKLNAKTSAINPNKKHITEQSLKQQDTDAELVDTANYLMHQMPKSSNSNTNSAYVYLISSDSHENHKKIEENSRGFCASNIDIMASQDQFLLMQPRMKSSYIKEVDSAKFSVSVSSTPNNASQRLSIYSDAKINIDDFDDANDMSVTSGTDDSSPHNQSNILVGGSSGSGGSMVVKHSSSEMSLMNSAGGGHNTISSHIAQNYSILAQEITAPLETDLEVKSWNPKPMPYQLNKNNNGPRAQKDIATCQFCGRAMLKKNIPTHIRRAHTPKEELVCLNEEQNIFTFQHLKPGQRRKRSARAYDYSLMTATVSIDEDPCEGIENKFITEGEEILSTDLLQLADRIKFGISQIPVGTLTKLIDILTKIEYSTTDDVCANAKAIKSMILLYMTSGEEFKYKLKQIGDDIGEKKKQVNNLRADLKEVMTRKAQLERRIQPIICDLQRLEDQHGTLIDTIMQLNGLIQLEIHPDNDDNDDTDAPSDIIC